MAVRVCKELEDHTKKLMCAINRERFESDSLCDATLRVDGKDFKVHKHIVGKVSPFFRKLFKVEMKESYDSLANLESMTAGILECILTCIYTGRIETDENEMKDLLSASNFLQIDELRYFCGDYLSKTLTVSKCLSLHAVGKQLNCELICGKAEDLMQDKANEIIDEDEFKNLDFAESMAFLKSIDQMHSVYKVKAVYEGIMAWVKHNQTDREKYLSDLLEIVKFRFFSSCHLNQIKKEEMIAGLAKYQSLLTELVSCRRATIWFDSGTPSRKQFVVISNKQIRLFDVVSFAWKQLPDLPENVSSACIVTYREHVYVIGGIANRTLIQRLNLEEDDSEWEHVGRTLEQRVNSKAVLFTGSVYKVGGTYGSSAIEQLEFGYNNKSWKIMSQDYQLLTCVAVPTSSELFLLQYQSQEILSFNHLSKTFNKTGIVMDNSATHSFDATAMEGKIYGFGRSSHGYKLTEYDIPALLKKEIWSGDLELKSSVITAI